MYFKKADLSIIILVFLKTLIVKIYTSPQYANDCSGWLLLGGRNLPKKLLTVDYKKVFRLRIKSYE